jgi:hypothetical protein
MIKELLKNNHVIITVKIAPRNGARHILFALAQEQNLLALSHELRKLICEKHNDVFIEEPTYLDVDSDDNDGQEVIMNLNRTTTS